MKKDHPVELAPVAKRPSHTAYLILTAILLLALLLYIAFPVVYIAGVKYACGYAVDETPSQNIDHSLRIIFAPCYFLYDHLPGYNKFIDWQWSWFGWTR